jgi:hypothetical protein
VLHCAISRVAQSDDTRVLHPHEQRSNPCQPARDCQEGSRALVQPLERRHLADEDRGRPRGRRPPGSAGEGDDGPGEEREEGRDEAQGPLQILLKSALC